MNILPIRIYACDALLQTWKTKTVSLSAETTYQAIVGSILVRIRKQMKVEQSAVAKAVGLNQSTWSRIERGESTLNVEQLFLAAAHMRIKPSIIISEAEQALEDLQHEEVVVSTAKSVDKRVGQGVALIGASALGALVSAALIKRARKSGEAEDK